MTDGHSDGKEGADEETAPPSVEPSERSEEDRVGVGVGESPESESANVGFCRSVEVGTQE